MMIVDYVDSLVFIQVMSYKQLKTNKIELITHSKQATGR